MPLLPLIVIKGVKVQRVAAGSVGAEKEPLLEEEEEGEEMRKKINISAKISAKGRQGGNTNSHDLKQCSGFCEWEPFSRFDL